MEIEQQLVDAWVLMKNKVLQLVCVIYICVSIFSSLCMFARSCDISNILLQPGGLYSFWFKGCYEYDNAYNKLYLRKHLQVQMLVYGAESNKGFNDRHDHRPLKSIIFGKDEFQIKDIFLASRLSLDNNLFLPGVMPSFGATKNEQYLALLAPTKVKIEAEKREFGFNASSIYIFKIPRTCYAIGAVGFQFPIRYQRHYMTLDFEGGQLFGSETVPMGNMLEENTLKQFFRDYQSVEDFFNRAILQPKGLTFLKRQHKMGIGDISFFSLVDVGLYFEYVEALQLGLNVILPSGNKRTGSNIWEVELGNGGAYQFEPFINVYFCCTRLINPMAYVGVRFSKDFTAVRRIPQQIVNRNNNANIADVPVIIPQRFSKHKIHVFNERDSSILHFADCVVRTTVSKGTEYLARIGNYMYDIMQYGFYLGMFYDIYVKRTDCLSVKNNKNFDTKFLKKFSEKTVHKFSWSLAYVHTNKIEIYIGSQHVVAGKNVIQHHKIFASTSWFF